MDWNEARAELDRLVPLTSAAFGRLVNAEEEYLAAKKAWEEQRQRHHDVYCIVYGGE